MHIVRNANFASAMISIFLYVSLTVTCMYIARKFWDPETNTLRGGRYAMPKFVFFVVLGTSTLFDLPSFIGCVAHGGPPSCVWNDASYAFCWSCHLIASCGYAFAIITPSILWSDIIQQKDGNFFNSSSPLDSIKIFFRVSYGLYCAVIAMTIMGVILYSKSSNEAQYSNSNVVGAISNCLSPILLFVITVGCVWCGTQLQAYVRNVQLGTATQVKIIRKLNITMILIATTYGVRAMLVLSLYGKMPNDYIHTFKPTQYYPLWVILTQWMPYILCSYSLVNSMRFKEEGKVSSKKARASAAAGAAATAAGLEAGQNSPAKSHRTGGSLRPNTSFSIESGLADDVRSPFDHTKSDDSGALTADESADGKTLDFLLAAVTETHSNNKNSYFNHEDGEDLSASPMEEHSIDHFFSTSALQARSNASMASSVASSAQRPVYSVDLKR